MELRRVGTGIHDQRAWYVADATDLRAAVAFTSPSPHFVLLLAADTRAATGPDLVDVASTFVRLGASYVCCWGPGAERLESCFDEAGFLLDPEPSDSGDVLMTTSHENESLEEAAWFAAWSTYPTARYLDSTKALLAVAIGRTDWSEQLATYLGSGAPMQDEA